MLTPTDSAYRELRMWGCIAFGVLSLAHYMQWITIPWYLILAPLYTPPLLAIALAYTGAFICYTADTMKRVAP